MAKTLLLNAELRDRKGSKAAAVLRKQGRIPAIVYGHKEEPVAISFDAHDFAEGLHHGNRLMDVKIGRKKQKMLVKDIQYDYLGQNVIHTDLIRVDITEMVKVSVPIELKGIAKGTQEGGIIEEHAAHLEIECRATSIPEKIVVSVKDVGVDDALHAADVQLPDGVKLVSPGETLLVTCQLVAAARTTEELEIEEPAAPEIIGEAKEENAEQAESGQ